LALCAAAAVPAADAAAGKTIYTERCAFCHGPSGRGDGPSGTALRPPPRDFTDRRFWETATPAEIADAIANGRPHTAMPAFRASLTPAQIADVITYIETFRHPGSRGE